MIKSAEKSYICIGPVRNSKIVDAVTQTIKHSSKTLYRSKVNRAAEINIQPKDIETI